jgi:hypothetical protein
MCDAYLFGDSGLGEKGQALLETKSLPSQTQSVLDEARLPAHDACKLPTNTNEDGAKPAQRSPYR